MPLREYKRKRDFNQTTEPIGKKSVKKKDKLVFVVQKHAAGHLHYDFRIEMNGALKSWAVPKGPSLDPTIKRLAVHVENHPMEYAAFEGVIPYGQYGAGGVMIWDQGEWVDVSHEKNAYKKGHLTLLLKGKRLKGLWKLIRLKNDPENWLLFKVNDEEAISEKKYRIIDEDKSIVSNKTMEEIQKKSRKQWVRRESSIVLTHPDKILYPEKKITKLDLAYYYERIQSWILPFVINRPLAIVRCPEGVEKECFFQKHLQKETLFIKDIDDLIKLIQMSTLEIHIWGCQIDKIERPDMITFDLDPGPDVSWKAVCDAGWTIHDYLEKLGLVSFLKVSGKKGLHITVPIKRLYTWEDIVNFSGAFSHTISELYPSDFVATMSKSKRKGKIFIDYFRNNRGSTAIAPYSTRADPKASIATPIEWDELNSKMKPDKFTIKNITKRINPLKWHKCPAHIHNL